MNASAQRMYLESNTATDEGHPLLPPPPPNPLSKIWIIHNPTHFHDTRMNILLHKVTLPPHPTVSVLFACVPWAVGFYARADWCWSPVCRTCVCPQPAGTARDPGGSTSAHHPSVARRASCVGWFQSAILAAGTAGPVPRGWTHRPSGCLLSSARSKIKMIDFSPLFFACTVWQFVRPLALRGKPFPTEKGRCSSHVHAAPSLLTNSVPIEWTQILSENPNTKRFKQTLINTDTQYANIWGNPLHQATKRHLNNTVNR